jgi:hypothetical protein
VEGGTRGKILGLIKESPTMIQSGEDLAQYSKSWRYHTKKRKRSSSPIL